MREMKASSKEPTRFVVRKRMLWQFSIARRKAVDEGWNVTCRRDGISLPETRLLRSRSWVSRRSMKMSASSIKRIASQSLARLK